MDRDEKTEAGDTARRKSALSAVESDMPGSAAREQDRRRQPPSATGAPCDPRSEREIDYGFLSGLVGFWVRRAQIKVFKSFKAHLEDLDLRPAEVATLFIVNNNPGLSQVALADALGTDPSTVVGLLRRLQRRKFVARRRLPSDRRFQVIALTNNGREMLEVIEDRLAAHNASLLAHLTPNEQRNLQRLLRRLVDG